MRKLLLQLDSSRLPSVFDRVVAYDGGADEVMSYGGITPGEVRDLVYGCIFTRGPKDLKKTAVFIRGGHIAAGEGPAATGSAPARARGCCSTAGRRGLCLFPNGPGRTCPG